MDVYWQYVRRGQNLMLSTENGQERIGGFRETKRGIDAYATTFGYEPGRSQKGFPTVEGAKAFVESFRPWELYAAHEVTVEPEVRPAAEPTAALTAAVAIFHHTKRQKTAAGGADRTRTYRRRGGYGALCGRPCRRGGD